VSLDDARRIVNAAREAGVFPAATVEIVSSAGPIWSEEFGTPFETPFDLASLTKVVATTTVVMELVRTGALHLDDRVSEFFAEWRGADRETVTVRDLLEHAGGLSARLLDAPPNGRREFEHDICAMPLEYVPRTASVYSDLGFLLLGFLAADRGGSSLADQFQRITIWLERDVLTFDLPADLRPFAAPTRPMEDDRRRGRVLIGEVHDEYAAMLGGVAGHAGLFGTASGVGASPVPSSAPPAEASAASPTRCRRRWSGSSPLRPPSPAVRAHSAGIRCCRLRLAAHGCRPRHSVMSATRALRSGSIRPATDISCCSPIARSAEARSIRCGPSGARFTMRSLMFNDSL